MSLSRKQINQFFKCLEYIDPYPFVTETGIEEIFNAKDLEIICKKGEVFSGPVQKHKMVIERCHDNCFKYIRKLPGIMYTGLALDDRKTWIVHSWIMNNSGKVIETTFSMKKYWGVPTKKLSFWKRRFPIYDWDFKL